MKTAVSLCVSIAILLQIAMALVSEAKPEEPGQAPPPAADPMRGKAPGEVRDDNGLKLTLVWCPPGFLTMQNHARDTEPAKEDAGEDRVKVLLTKGYWLGKYEVTQSEWKEVMKTEPWMGAARIEAADFPATHVAWKDAVDFCRKLTEQERQAGRMSNDWEYTLPTEAQWERACRARTETKFSFGDDESKLGEYAWFGDNISDAGEQGVQRVGQKKANPWGLCDMYGNVWEWCRDGYTKKLPGGRDPDVQPDENIEDWHRVVRGGGWGAARRTADRRSGKGTRRGISAPTLAFVSPSVQSGDSPEARITRAATRGDNTAKGFTPPRKWVALTGCLTVNSTS